MLPVFGFQRKRERLDSYGKYAWELLYIRLERGEVRLVENFNLESAYVRNWKYAQLVVQFLKLDSVLD